MTAKAVVREEDTFGSPVINANAVISKVGDPAVPTDAANKKYVDAQIVSEGADIGPLFHNYLTAQEASITAQFPAISLTSNALTSQLSVYSGALTAQNGTNLVNYLDSVGVDLNKLCTTVNRLEALINAL